MKVPALLCLVIVQPLGMGASPRPHTPTPQQALEEQLWSTGCLGSAVCSLPRQDSAGTNPWPLQVSQGVWR